MKRICTLGLLVLLTCIFFAIADAQIQKSDSHEITVIVGGTLIDGTGKEPVRDSVIVVEGNTIKSVGEKGKVTYPQNAKTIDAAGKFILPGLTDCHIHYRPWLPELLLAHGVTGMVDMGNPTDWILAQRDGIAKGKLIGPRIWASGDQLGVRAPAANLEEATRTIKGHIAKGVNKLAMTMLQGPETLKMAVEEARKANIPISAWTMYPREAIELGVDALEHSYTLGIATRYKDPKTLDEIRREQSKSTGRYEKKSMNYLMDAADDDFIELLVRKGAYVIPDLVFDFKIINDRYKEFEQQNYALLMNPNLKYIPVDDWFPQLMSFNEAGITHDPAGLFGTLDRGSDDFRKWQKGYRIEQEFIRKLVKVGGKVLAGTDAPNILLPGISMHHELQLLVDAGLTPMQAIIAGTRWPAEFLRQQKILGTVEAGKLADLIVLRADPLVDITNTQKIDMVMKDGQVLDTSYHPDFSNPLPRGIISESQMNQVPTVTNILPKIVTEGDSDVALTVQGRDFMRLSLVAFDGEWLPTVFVKDTEMKATIPARLLKRVGTFPVTVWSPRPFGGMSKDVKFYVKFK